ncbi:hypothetical protein KIW84_023679 [Lathyrus oleraceus]|uniref:Uncharacterized protein n=1 Tax=Pisum sativum TaxID=3888 RepID=A0A9D4YDL1_PEA|nr:hypothetical protein KIW84_023679 [Pisum sativum]
MKLSYNVQPTASDDIARQLPPLTVLSAPNSSTPHKLGLTLSIKLQENNYLLSNQQVEGVILGQKAHKVVMNPRIPVKFKTPQDQLEGKISDVYEIWIIQDQFTPTSTPASFQNVVALHSDSLEASKSNPQALTLIHMGTP